MFSLSHHGRGVSLVLSPALGGGGWPSPVTGPVRSSVLLSLVCLEGVWGGGTPRQARGTPSQDRDTPWTNRQDGGHPLKIGQGYTHPLDRTGVLLPPPPRQDRRCSREYAASWVVCLLQSSRRTFLFSCNLGLKLCWFFMIQTWVL